MGLSAPLSTIIFAVYVDRSNKYRMTVTMLCCVCQTLMETNAKNATFEMYHPFPLYSPADGIMGMGITNKHARGYVMEIDPKKFSSNGAGHVHREQ
jgi:hypothetical protein